MGPPPGAAPPVAGCARASRVLGVRGAAGGWPVRVVRVMDWPEFVPISARRPLFWSDEAVAFVRVALLRVLRRQWCQKRVARPRLRRLAARRCASVRRSRQGAGTSLPRIAPCPLLAEMRGDA